jgi:Homeodomain-like domain
MARELTRHELDAMLAQGLSQREISKRTGMPRSTLYRLLRAPQVPEVLPPGPPVVAPGRPLPQTIIDASPVILEMVQWWMERKAAAASPAGGHQETKRYTFHADITLIEMVQREADAERVSYSEICNRALRQYFSGR